MKSLTVIAAALSLVTASFAMAGTRVLMTTSMGDITLELADEQAPETVANFLKYADDGTYNGTVFHRVIDGFMIQGGVFNQL